MVNSYQFTIHIVASDRRNSPSRSRRTDILSINNEAQTNVDCYQDQGMWAVQTYPCPSADILAVSISFFKPFLETGICSQ